MVMMNQNGAARVQLRRLIVSLSSSQQLKRQGSSTSTCRLRLLPSLPQRLTADRRSFYVDQSQRRHRRLGQNTFFYIRSQSTLTSNAFWKSLDNAVEDGNGASAQQIVENVVEEYKKRLQNGPKINGTAQKELLDTRMFSMVLQAWKNGPCVSVESALAAQTLLGRMISLAEKGLLLEKPSVLDYLAVLECWGQASKHDDTSRSTILKHVEELWNLLPAEVVTNGYEETFYNTLLEVLANSGQGEHAEQCLEEYKQHQLAGTRSTENATAVVSTNMCLAVIQAHVNSSEADALERAEEFLSKMRADRSLPQPTTEFYNLLLEAWASPSRQRDFSIAAARLERLLDEMKQARVQPDATSYQYGLEVLARMGEGIRAEALLTSLLKEYTNQFDAGLKPGIKPFRTVLWAYSNSHHPDAATHAESVLNNMEELCESGFDTCPETWDYNLVLKCWSRSRSPKAVERAMDLYGKMVSPEASADAEDVASSSRSRCLPKPDITSLNTLLNTSGRHEQDFQLEQLLWKFYYRHVNAPSRNPCPDTVSFSVVMRSWSKSKDHDAPERAEKLLKKLESLYAEGNKNCKPDLQIYSLLMSCWAKSKRKEGPWRVESIFRRLQAMAQNGNLEMNPDAACWNIAINGWVGDGRRAEALFMEMIETNRNNPSAAVMPTAVTLTNVMNAWAKTRSSTSSQCAISLLRKLQRFYEDGTINVKPNVVCYSLALESLASDRTVQSAIDAEEILREMLASNDPVVQPNVVSYNCVIKAWSFSGHPEAFAKASALLKEVIRQSQTNEKMMPTIKTFGGVLKCLAESNISDKKKRAEAIVGLMKRFNCNQDKWTQNVLSDCLGRRK
ncbi:PPR: pentatricopeptide repeat domain containing protein [Nitzschia inconspicua]|uniref:PPR: pentatricopeptide repeat domain containing protein n=1 Tax=Nitzschia inconspicua TaxID=303405 RepID=A0A9K3PS39_9STRA|nr:PPR: pentatricopeptide repeat domain containing protein [Nitzschia inconspicua]